MSSNKAALVFGFVTALALAGCSAFQGLGDLGGYGGDSCAESYQGKKHECGTGCCDDETDPPAGEPAPAPTTSAPLPKPKPKPETALPDGGTTD
jgi:hypothetical protein